VKVVEMFVNCLVDRSGFIPPLLIESGVSTECVCRDCYPTILISFFCILQDWLEKLIQILIVLMARTCLWI